jgi:hypothetical protein
LNPAYQQRYTPAGQDGVYTQEFSSVTEEFELIRFTVTHYHDYLQLTISILQEQ